MVGIMRNKAISFFTVFFLFILVSALLQGCGSGGGGGGTGSRDDGSTVGTLKGIVEEKDTLTPLQGAAVTLGAARDSQASRDQQISTDAQGKFELGNLAPGKYTVIVALTGYAQLLSTVEIEADATTDMKALLSKEGDQSTGIYGIVSDSQGRPIGGAQVSLDYAIRSGTRSIATVTTGSDGKYTFTGLSAGDYAIRAEHPSYLPNTGKVSVSLHQMAERNIILYWNLIYNGHGETLLGLWGTDERNVFAVGEMGAIKHYDGSSWSYLPYVTSNTLIDIWGTSGGKVILAVGLGGTILRSTDNGATWSLVPSSTTNPIASAFGSPDGSYILAVSSGGDVLASTTMGKSWQSIGSLGAHKFITNLWCGSDGVTFYAVNSMGVILRSVDKGKTWTEIYKDMSARWLRMVWGTPDGRTIIAVGGNVGTIGQGAVIISVDGGKTWKEYDKIQSPCDFYAVSGTPDGNSVFIGGINYDNYENAHIYHLTRTNNDYTPEGIKGTVAIVGDCWMTADGKNAFMSTYMGRIYGSSNGGNTFSLLTGGDTGTLHGIFGFSSGLYSVGDRSGVRHSDKKWASMKLDNDFFGVRISNDSLFFRSICNIPNPEPGDEEALFMLDRAYGIWATYDGGDQLWLVDFWPYYFGLDLFDLWCLKKSHVAVSPGVKIADGTGVIYLSYYYDNPTDYKIIPLNSLLYPQAVWGAGDDSILIAVASAGMTYRSTDQGEHWTPVQTPVTDHLDAVWGTSDGSVIYAVGFHNTVLRSTDKGLTWSIVDIGEKPPLGTFSAIWGTSGHDIYVGGQNVYHFDGTSWKKMVAYLENGGESGVFNVEDLWGTPDGKDIYAAGTGGRIYHHQRP